VTFSTTSVKQRHSTLTFPIGLHAPCSPTVTLVCPYSPAAYGHFPQVTMVENKNKAVKDKLTDSEKKKIKQENKSKANPKQAEAKKEKNDNKREKRAESGSTKTFS